MLLIPRPTTRRWAFAAGALLAALLALPVAAVDRGRQVLVAQPDQADRLMDAVENAAWAADGQGADKPVYVVYNTQCAFSQRFFQDSRALAGQVQLRWIPAMGQGATAVVESRDAAAVAAAFAGRAAPAADEARARRAVDYNARVQDSISYLLRGLDNSRTFAYPTLVYRTARGVKVVAGAPANLAALAAEVLPQPAKAGLVPRGLAISARPVQVQPSRQLPKWYHTRPTPMVFRAAPDEAAAPVDELAKDYLLPVSGIVADGGWIEVAMHGPRGPRSYVHDPVMARMALLDFRVQPQGGAWDTAGPTEARAFPDPESPVLETLGAGERYPRKGVVELGGRRWVQIQLYQDGTVAYVPQA